MAENTCCVRNAQSCTCKMYIRRKMILKVNVIPFRQVETNPKTQSFIEKGSVSTKSRL